MAQSPQCPNVQAWPCLGAKRREGRRQRTFDWKADQVHGYIFRYYMSTNGTYRGSRPYLSQVKRCLRVWGPPSINQSPINHLPPRQHGRTWAMLGHLDERRCGMYAAAYDITRLLIQASSFID